MRCDFCGYEFREEEARQGCSNCPLTRGCRMIKCPRCNYEIPPEPLWIERLRKLLGKRTINNGGKG